MNRSDVRALDERIETALEKNRHVPRDDEERQIIEAVRLAGRRLVQIVDRTPWEAVPPSWLDAVQAAFDPVVASIQDYTAYEGDDAEPAVTWAEIDRLWGSLNQFQAAILPEESVTEDAASFRRSVGQLIRRLTDEVEAAQGEVGRIRTELTEITAARDAALAEMKAQREALSAEVSQQSVNIETAARDQAAQFSAALDENEARFRAALVQHNESLTEVLEDTAARTAEAISDTEKNLHEAQDRIEELEARALKSYNTIGNAGLLQG